VDFSSKRKGIIHESSSSSQKKKRTHWSSNTKTINLFHSLSARHTPTHKQTALLDNAKCIWDFF